MKSKKIMDETANRYEFNRVRKRFLEHKGEIRCTYCRYHRGDNQTNMFYGSYGRHIKYPNWKLVSKNKKQWMNKPIKIKTKTNQNGEWIKITW
jgi:hypothetical protein